MLDERGPFRLMQSAGPNDTVFAGSIPAIYDRYMVPLFFRPYARELSERARRLQPKLILETASGTGVVTELLHQALPHAQIIATDLNEPMLAQAAARIRQSNVVFRYADALALPFEDESFDLVICQFGVMFFPDKVRGNAEARRVLRPGGGYLLAIWDEVGRNLATKVVGTALAQMFQDETAAFYERLPFRYHDIDTIHGDLRAAGFERIEIETVELRSHAASARDVAIALTQGTPMRSEIEAWSPEALANATEAAEHALRIFETEVGFDAPMSAHIVTATK
jgi:ubiquinone/menaquinone biosynthesis C-methylase UbiE